MGCTSPTFVREDINLKQEQIILNVNTNYHKKELTHAQSLINLISRIRNKIIYLYHKLIYDTGACLFLNPTIKHCFKSILYKISTDLEGKLKYEQIQCIEDPPYMKINNIDTISKNGNDLLNDFLNFIVEIKSYKLIIKQIDKETPGLLYLINENKENISSENINNINKGIELFKNMIIIRNDIILIYKSQLRDYLTQKEKFIDEINKIGAKAFELHLTDIYDIVLLKKDDIHKDNAEDRMHNSIKDAKKNMEGILTKEINDEIINSHESIIIEKKEDF